MNEVYIIYKLVLNDDLKIDRIPWAFAEEESIAKTLCTNSIKYSYKKENKDITNLIRITA